jgi:mannose-6-phosphate isomerase-like protein (cupin superfamily)
MNAKVLCVLAMMVVAPSAVAGQVLTPTVPPPVTLENGADDARTILGRYAEAWSRKAGLGLVDGQPVLGFEITGAGGGSYHVVLETSGPGTLLDGPPPADHQVIFRTDMDFLRRLDRGELNALTALGQARGDDPTPLVPRFPPGFRWTSESRAAVLPLVFHFWNREWPSVIRFGDGTTREIHGGSIAVLYYDAGLRTAWAQLMPRTHINEDTGDQSNPFSSLFIITRGVGVARIGGVEMTLQEGQAVLVPPGTPHEFWTDDGQYAECVVIMFGPGA